MSSPKKYSKNYTTIIHLFQDNLREYPKIIAVCEYFLSHPDILHTYFAEIDTAIFMYNHLEKLDIATQELYINAAYLKSTDPKFIFPDTCDVFEDIFTIMDRHTFITEFFSDFKAMDNTHFFENTQAIDLGGTLFIGAYRTYLRIKNPQLVAKNVQFASIIEEMLALMAIRGEKTKLFLTIKFWIMLWKKEEFSQELALAVNLIK